MSNTAASLSFFSQLVNNAGNTQKIEEERIPRSVLADVNASPDQSPVIPIAAGVPSTLASNVSPVDEDDPVSAPVSHEGQSTSQPIWADFSMFDKLKVSDDATQSSNP